jgi:hypothetical protein
VLPGRRFELIWCGSLLTHLDRDRWSDVLGFFVDRLPPDGIVVFTTHGRRSIQWMRDGVNDYGLRREEQDVLIRAYEECGFGFLVSADHPSFEMSLSSSSFVCAQVNARPELRLIGLEEAGWAGHQDVFACQRLRVPFFPVRSVRLQT